MSNNNNNNETAAGIGIIGGGIILMGLLLFAVVAFITVILTLLCLVAMFTPVKLGKWTLESEEAARFLRNGLIGSGLLPLFIFFCNSIFGLGVDWDYLPHMMGVGYVFGSVGWELVEAGVNNQPQDEVLPPVQSITHKSGNSQVSPDGVAESFRFASWDDEEEVRK